MRPTLLTLRERYGFTTTAVASAARVAPDVVYFMLVGRSVKRGDAEKVLAAISYSLEQDLHLGNVAVVLEEGDDEPGEC